MGVKRFRRIVLNGLTVLSLGLALLVAVSWVGSYWRAFDIARDDAKNQTFQDIFVTGGRATISLFQSVRRPTTEERIHFVFGCSAYVPYPQQDYPRNRFIGFGWDDSFWGPLGGLRCYIVPLWFVQLLFAALPATRLYRHVRRRYRVLTGHCRKCGYDLRATPDRCPECGMPAAPDGVV